MILECTEAFGNFVPGDEVEVPDGDAFDTAHFKAKEAAPDQPAKD